MIIEAISTANWVSLVSGLIGSLFGAAATLVGVALTAKHQDRHHSLIQEREEEAVLHAIALDVHDQGPVRSGDIITSIATIPRGNGYTREVNILSTEPNLLTVFSKQIFRLKDKTLIATIVRYYAAEHHAKRAADIHRKSLDRYYSAKARLEDDPPSTTKKAEYEASIGNLVDTTDDMALRLRRFLVVGRELLDRLPYEGKPTTEVAPK